MKFHQSKAPSAFTLVELLVCIAIIAVLAALMLGPISKVKSKAKGVQCMNNLHQLGIGIQTFIAENHAYPSFISGTNGNNPGTWESQLERGGFDISKPKKLFFAEGVWLCPSARWKAEDWKNGSIPSCYGYNTYGVGGGGHTNALGLQGRLVSMSDLFAPIGESEVVSPGEMMAIGDSIVGGVLFTRQPFSYLDQKGRASSRHQGKLNVVFCDGHVESPTLKFLFEDTSDEALRRWNRDHQPHRERR